MKLQLDQGTARYQIRAYQAGVSILINDTHYQHSLIVAPSQLQAWSATDFAALKSEDFALLLAFQPRILLFGSGAHFRFPTPRLLAPLYDAGIGVEVMDTGAACRTYAVLAAEGRAVVAALLL